LQAQHHGQGLSKSGGLNVCAFCTGFNRNPQLMRSFIKWHTHRIAGCVIIHIHAVETGAYSIIRMAC